ncbi:HD-GYP domain, c-di-GMP phosphodiesterase class II (or its inactivated variant) [Alkalispirochaeta americana]|uniref:HD-GYP domain, c-di-GMP phosphodiesterase class II (Or its inactivated variant) n=1 Tax=Alkalispirochaeta americana TaxID=159291 RepID=A0A1N6W4L8_9SPIO|nr:HD domain-containing phosphohydrolase [Alkalispirochaeta americana]SIQ85059.1 HD-GYP domain, c-di-GMP phosphodiesterase class II (or its inactivated variant) [Alkalispirochaeta americana]
MKTIATSQLSEGLYITREAFLDEKYILLSPEIPLDASLLERLEQWHFQEIQSEGELAETPALGNAGPVAMEDAPLAAIDHGRRDGREMGKAQKKYVAHLHFAEQLFGHYLQNGILQTNQIHEKIKLLLEDLRNQKQYLLRIPELGGVTVNYIVDHAVKTAIVAMATGSSMKLPPHRLIELGTVGLLHEIGMIRLPSQLYMSNRELNPREKKAISTHPVLGFKILRQFDFPLQICLGVLECRENVDGSGYPRNLPANKISIYGKIMNAASTFAAMASPRPYRPAIDGHTIMKTLLTGVNTSYDNTVLQAMIGTFSLFPYGTYVQLASGHRAIVIDITPGKARAPKVQILTDPKGTIVREQPVTETETEQYAVTGVLSHQEVTRLKNAL